MKMNRELVWNTVDEKRQECERCGIVPRQHGDPCQSCFSIPLRSGEQALGVLSIQSYEPHAFTPILLDICRALGTQLTVALQNTRLIEQTQQREKLLDALDKASLHIRALKDPATILHEVIRQATQLLACEAGCLLINRSHLMNWRSRPCMVFQRRCAVGDIHMPRVLLAWLHAPVLRAFSAIALSRPLKMSSSRQTVFEVWLGVPLLIAGAVEAVLVIGDRSGTRELALTDMEILERFAAQAAIALQTSRLVSLEQRMFSQMSILNQISSYIQAASDLERILHAVLTGVTAGYGLGFNCAALFLLDERRERLVGRMGIGQVDEDAAHRDWAEYHTPGHEDFRRYLGLLEKDASASNSGGESYTRSVAVHQCRWPSQRDHCDRSL